MSETFRLPDGPCVTDDPHPNCVIFGDRYIKTGELVHRTFYGYSSIIKILNGIKTPSLKGAIQLADALGVSVDTLVRELAISGSQRKAKKRRENQRISQISA